MGLVEHGGPRDLILQLKQMFGVQNFVETGTNHATTSVWASDHFSRVVTIEGYKPLYASAIAKYGMISNLEFRLGDSGLILQEVLGSLNGPAIIWLDAHWCGTETFGNSNECPVTAELQAINSAAVDHIILIDDARLFLEPPKPPHEASHWPGLAELIPLLDPPSAPRYVAVSRDVIIAVPRSAQQGLVAFLRTQPELKLETPAISPLRRVLRRVRRSRSGSALPK